MKTRLALLAAMVGLVFSLQPLLAQDCTFQLGFKSLHDLIPDIVGDCLDDEQHNPATGLTQQSTTNGQLTWRKADNWTGFSDGEQTWINGPEGLQQRLNSEQFPWEAAAHAAPDAGPAAQRGVPPPAPRRRRHRDSQFVDGMGHPCLR